MNWRCYLSNCLFCFVAALVVPYSSSVAALTLDVDGGILLGAQGVSVNGTLYDVAFVDGTCDAVFSGCAGSFAFGSEEEAIAASQALIDFVLTDSPQGLFASDPASVFGITEFYANFITPFAADATDIAAVSAFISSGFSFVLDGVPYSRLLDTSSTDGGALAWVRWTEASNTVPEPSMIALVLAGLVVLAVYRRQHSKACDQSGAV